MKKLQLIPRFKRGVTEPIQEDQDVLRIVKAFAARGCEITQVEAETAWIEYSDSMAAGWLIMDNYLDEDLFEILRPSFKEEEPETDRDYWGEDPEFPVCDWQYEVANNDTRHGYWEWVKHEKEIRRDGM